MTRRGLLGIGLALALAGAAAAEPMFLPPRPAPTPADAPLELDVLRVCSDPNNLPFSNQAEEGFENRIAELLAEELDVPLEYEWRAQRRGFIREGLNGGECNVIIGTLTGLGMASTTRPYYRSSYVFLSREADDPGIEHLDDPELREVTVGVHTIGDDYANPPGAHALGKRGINQHVIGFRLLGDYGQPNPPARLVEAVADGTVDVAIVWGPFAGYFGNRLDTPMVIRPVQPVFDPPGQPFVYSVSMAVRFGNYPLRKRLNKIIRDRQEDIDRILAEYDVPRIDTGTEGD